MGDRGAGVDVLVAGYASIDVVLRADASPAPGRQVLLSGPVAPMPQFGGSGPIVSLVLAGLGIRTGLITWLGDDDLGRRYLERLQAAGVETSGVAVGSGQSSPRRYLIHDPEGRPTILFHPSGSAALGLTESGHSLLTTTRLLAVTQGPAPLTDALLTERPLGVGSAWHVKPDPDAYPAALRRRLVQESVIVCLDRRDLPFVAEAVAIASDDAEAALDTLVEIRGGTFVATAWGEGCTVAWPDGQARVPAEFVPAQDATGAGEIFFAAFLAATLAGASPIDAAAAATEAVRRGLAARNGRG